MVDLPVQGAAAQTAVTVFMPDIGTLSYPPIVCFAFPGGGYSREYFSLVLPDGVGPGGQAGWHRDRGWIFVACDPLGFGTSSTASGLSLEMIAAGIDTTVSVVLQRLASGTLVEDYPPVARTTRLGIGQSMGGALAIIAQAHHRSFDAVASLGFSGIHTSFPSRPGGVPLVVPWIVRNSAQHTPVILNPAEPEIGSGTFDSAGSGVGFRADADEIDATVTWVFHFDDEPPDLVTADMAGRAGRGPLPPWRSPQPLPDCTVQLMTPGAIAR